MRIKHRLLFAGSLLAGAVALGCQTPTPVGAPKPVRVLTTAGTMQLDAATDLALQFRQPCADGNPAYDLKSLDSRIAMVKLTITGPSYPDGHTFEISRADFEGDCTLTQQFSGLLAGTYTLTMLGVDASGKGVMQQKTPQSVVISEEGPQAVVLKCDFTNGDMEVTIDCCSPPPSPTPSPLPTATPVPPPVTFSYATGAWGFTVDAVGRTYVFAADQFPATGEGAGRIYRFEPGVPMPTPSIFDDNVDYMAEGSIFGGSFHGVSNESRYRDANGQLNTNNNHFGISEYTLDLNQAFPTPTWELLSVDPVTGCMTANPGHAANAFDPGTGRAYFGATRHFYHLNSAYLSLYHVADAGIAGGAITRYTYEGGLLPQEGAFPHSMEWAAVRRRYK